MEERWLVCRIEEGNIEVIKEAESKDSAKEWVLMSDYSGAYFTLPAFRIDVD